MRRGGEGPRHQYVTRTMTYRSILKRLDELDVQMKLHTKQVREVPPASPFSEREVNEYRSIKKKIVQIRRRQRGEEEKKDKARPREKQAASSRSSSHRSSDGMATERRRNRASPPAGCRKPKSAYEESPSVGVYGDTNYTRKKKKVHVKSPKRPCSRLDRVKLRVNTTTTKKKKRVLYFKSDKLLKRPVGASKKTTRSPRMRVEASFNGDAGRFGNDKGEIKVSKTKDSSGRRSSSDCRRQNRRQRYSDAYIFDDPPSSKEKGKQKYDEGSGSESWDEETKTDRACIDSRPQGHRLRPASSPHGTRCGGRVGQERTHTVATHSNTSYNTGNKTTTRLRGSGYHVFDHRSSDEKYRRGNDSSNRPSTATTVRAYVVSSPSSSRRDRCRRGGRIRDAAQLLTATLKLPSTTLSRFDHSYYAFQIRVDETANPRRAPAALSTYRFDMIISELRGKTSGGCSSSRALHPSAIPSSSSSCRHTSRAYEQAYRGLRVDPRDGLIVFRRHTGMVVNIASSSSSSKRSSDRDDGVHEKKSRHYQAHQTHGTSLVDATTLSLSKVFLPTRDCEWLRTMYPVQLYGKGLRIVLKQTFPKRATLVDHYIMYSSAQSSSSPRQSSACTVGPTKRRLAQGASATRYGDETEIVDREETVENISLGRFETDDDEITSSLLREPLRQFLASPKHDRACASPLSSFAPSPPTSPPARPDSRKGIAHGCEKHQVVVDCDRSIRARVESSFAERGETPEGASSKRRPQTAHARKRHVCVAP